MCRFLDRLVASIEAKLVSANKMGESIGECERKRAEVQDTMSTTHTQLTNIISATKQLKQQTEGELQKIFKGRRVNLIGDINTI